MKVIFLGTPNFARYVLDKLYNSKHEVVAVVTQPDKKSGRGNKFNYSPVKQYALERDIRILQFRNIKKNESIEELKSIDADIMVTCAYGQILSQEVIDVKNFGVINTHASILPKYRGAAPIHWAIIKGEKETGVSIMQTDIGMDTGDVILTKKINIEDIDTTGSLTEKLMDLSANALIEALDSIESRNAKFYSQDHANATHYPMLKKNDGYINFNNNSLDIINFVRGVNPWPCAFTFIKGNYIKIHRATIVDINDIEPENHLNGEIVYANSKKGLIIKVNDGFIRLNIVQGQGLKKMRDIDYINGHKVPIGFVLGRDDEQKPIF